MDKKKELQKTVLHEIEYLLRHNTHPPIHADTDAVWIFSGPGTFAKPLQQNEFHFWEKWMDKYRILYGVSIAQQITAKRTGKNVQKITKEDLAHNGPYIIYNGTPQQNKEFMRANLNDSISFPTKKILVIDHAHNDDGSIHPIVNTLDQIKNLDEDLIKIDSFRRVAVVSHAEHFPRILRYLEKYKPLSEETIIEVFSLKPPKNGISEYNREEIEKVWEYFQKGDLSFNPLPVEV